MNTSQTINQYLAKGLTYLQQLILKKAINPQALFLAIVISLVSIFEGIPSNQISAQAVDVSINIDQNSILATSNFSPGWTVVDRSLYATPPRDTQAVNDIKSLINDGIPYTNTHIMAWGVSDIWPDPHQPKPHNWNTLDNQMNNILDTGSTPVITLMNAPWWMKGTLQPDGTTKLIPSVAGEWHPHTYSTSITDFRGITYPAGYISPDPYNGRVLDSQMDNWLIMVESVAERYMVEPYNVRHFQVWNEMKGYYNPSTNRTDIDTSSGNTSGYQAKHGYTYMYNRVYRRLKQVARENGIPESEIKVGGPYMIVDSEQTSLSHPSNEVRGEWGILDQRDLDDMRYWLNNKVGAEFITIDERNRHTRKETPKNGFIMNQKLADTRAWIRQQPNGGATLPIWVAEFYVEPHNITGDPEITSNAVAADALIKIIPYGTSVPLFWGGHRDVHSKPPLWTDPEQVGGGQPTLFYHTYKKLGDNFSPGTPIYNTTVSDPTKVSAMAGPTQTVLINKTSTDVSVAVEGISYQLTGYEVKWIETPTVLPPTPTPTSAPSSTPTPEPSYTDCSSLNSNQVIIFSDKYCQGTKQAFQSGNSIDLNQLNNQVSSIYVPEDWVILVFNDQGQQGDSRCVAWDMWDLSKDLYSGSGVFMDNSISSITTLHQPDCPPSQGTPPELPAEYTDCGDLVLNQVALFLHTNCKGAVQTFPTFGVFNVDMNFNDQASSVRVPPGWSARVYFHADLQGESSCISWDKWDFTKDSYQDTTLIINDSISSIQVFDQPFCQSSS